MTMVSGLAVIINMWRFNPMSPPYDTPRSPGAPLGVLHRRRPKIAVRSGTLFAAVHEFEKYSELVILVGVRGNNGCGGSRSENE